MTSNIRVAVVGGSRTPFVKAGTVFRKYTALDLGVHSVNGLLAKTGLSLSDMDLIEMHEAFGGQVASNLRAWEQGWKEPAIGSVEMNRERTPAMTYTVQVKETGPGNSVALLESEL